MSPGRSGRNPHSVTARRSGRQCIGTRDSRVAGWTEMSTPLPRWRLIVRHRSALTDVDPPSNGARSPVSPTGAVLLLQEQDPARPGELYWSSIGGAVDSGESLPEAVRELWEETGILVGHDRLAAPVHRGVRAYSWDGVDYVADSTYFVVPLGEHVEVNFDHLEPEEVGNVLAAGWWAPAVLAGVEFRPPDLPEIMSTALTAYADRPG